MMSAQKVTAGASQHVHSLKAICGNELSKAVKNADFDFLMEVQRKKVHIEGFRDENGDTALHTAAKEGNPALLEFLVEPGQTAVDCRNLKGETPLHAALAQENLDAAHFLIESGANVNQEIAPPADTTGARPVEYPVAPRVEPVMAVVDPLRAEEELDSEDDDDASEDSSEEESDSEDESDGDDGDATPEERQAVLRLQNSTPLHSAVTDGNEGLVTFLVENGADLNAQNGLKETPLHIAVQKGLDRICVLLVTRGAKPLHNIDGMTPLHLAFQAKNEAIMCLLAESGFDVGARLDDSDEDEENTLAEDLNTKAAVTDTKPLPAKKSLPAKKASTGVFRPAGNATAKAAPKPGAKPVAKPAAPSGRGLPSPRTALPAKRG